MEQAEKEQLRQAKLEREQMEKKKEEEEEVLGATKPILSDDIRKLMEQLENGEEPEITDEDAEDFVDDEEDEATESPEDSSKEASDTDEEEPEENDFEEIVDSEEDDESDAVYDEEAEYEDEDDSEYAPSGCVSFLTIHQSKGMEFPIVFVDSLTNVPRKIHKRPYDDDRGSLLQAPGI